MARRVPCRRPPVRDRLCGALRAIALGLCATLALMILHPSRGLAEGEAAGPLLQRLTPAVLTAIFPDARELRMAADDGPIAAEVWAEGQMLGYAFSTLDVLRAPGYSSTPFDVVAGVTLTGQITGAVVLFHREPYLLNDDRRTAQLVRFLTSLEGLEARLGAEGGLEPGFVAGATISARAMRNAVLEGARMVLRYRTEEVVVTEPTIDMINFKPLAPDDLVAEGGLVRARITNADLVRAMVAAGLGDYLPEVAPMGGAKSIYIDFVAGYGNPPMIGRNGVGLEPYDALINDRPAGSHGIFAATLGGAYDHRGTRFNNLSAGLQLERVSVTQAGRTWTFTKPEVIFAPRQVADLLVLPPDSGFDPMRPWQIDLHAAAALPDGTLRHFVLASLTYALPARYILMPEAAPPPAWLEAWQVGRGDVAIMAGALMVLTAILALQGPLTRRRRLHLWLRRGFLTFTLVWIGWIASAQLSIVHLVNYLKAPFAGLGLGFYLAEPLIVMISVYTAVSLVLLGRGVFCGWLCPFGAMQELLAQVARALRLPQWNPAQGLQRLLWWGKYASLATILTLVVLAPEAAPVAEEIEPFKTAITAMFQRGWPYVLYALALLAVGLFTERAFCRFLCPLGGALAILDRLHLVDLLKRRPECGNPCHLCERSCPVRAIERSGKIVMAECFQCLDCQVEYYDDRRCPPLAIARKRRTRGGGRAVGLPVEGIAALRAP